MFEFTAKIVDQITGVLLIEELPCEVEATLDEWGDIRVDDVKVDGISLYSGSPMSASVAAQVIDQLMGDGEFLEHIGAPSWTDADKRAELGTW